MLTPAMLIALNLFTHLMLPVIFLWWLARTRVRSRLLWLCLALLVSGYIVAMFYVGAGWSWFGVFWPYIFLIALGVVTSKSYVAGKALPLWPEKKVKPWMGFACLAPMSIYMWSALPDIFTARDYDKSQAVALSFPLTGGTFHIGHGGSNETVNYHQKVLAQRFALDITKLNNFGARASGILPNDTQAYVIFGSRVLAPCSGEVIASESSLADLAQPKMDSENILGNHVILFCNNATILLAHLKQNSLTVKTGDHVESGTGIAQVGNTGQTSEPHLHVHPVSGRHIVKDEIAYKAEGLPMTFNAHFYIRNDLVKRP